MPHTTRSRTAARRLAAATALLAIAAAIALPAAALAADNLVSSYSLPADWLVVMENNVTLWARNTYGSGGGTLGYDIEWTGFAEVKADLVMPGDTFSPHFASFDDFAAGSAAVPIGEDDMFWADQRAWTGAQKTSLGGLEAYMNRATVRQESSAGATAHYADYWVYWVPTDDGGGIIVTAQADVSWSEEEPWTGTHYGSQLDPIAAQTQALLDSLRFSAQGGTAAAPGLPGAAGNGVSPWRTVTGGLAAVAAAAVALAGALAGARAKTGAEEPPADQPVGYLLQLSTRALTVSAEHPATLTVQAFRVLPDGRYGPAPEAGIAVTPSAGLGVQPSSAYGTLAVTVWQTAALAPGAAIAIQATAPLGATQATVPVSAAGESRIVTRLEPAGTLALRTQGDHSVTLVAVVELLGADAADPAVDPVSAQDSLAFAESSEWLEVSEAVDYEGGRAIAVMASQPDPTSPVQPPESATVRITARIGERLLTELVAIPLARLPEMDAKPDEVSFAAESGAVAEAAIVITNAGDTPWQFDTLWREGSRAIASATIEPTGPSAATLTLTEDGGENLDPTRPQTASTLVVVATADGYDELRRHVDVTVTQEGLFIDRTNVDPSTGAFALAADGSGRPTAIDLRVFVRDPATGEIGPDIGLAQQASLEIGGQEGTSGHAGLRAAGLTVEPAGVRQLNIPSATFNASLERTLPTAGEPVPAALLASVPGYDADRFSALVPLRLLGVDMEPYSDAWESERDNCLDIIRGYVPSEHQDRLYALVAERSRTMGAEGLFQMRKQLWSFAYDQLMKEKHEHLDAAWWYQQIEDTLEWVSWCGDIAIGVISGTAVGTVGAIALGMLKPLLVSAMEVWLAGGSLDDWLLAQTSTLTGVLEGSLTDPDFLTRLSGEKKAIGWALFIAYYFATELYNDPNLSVTNAAKNVARQLRDEGLVRFLQMIATKKGFTPKAGGADTGTPKTAGADAGAPKTATDAPGTKPAAPDTPQTGTPVAPDAPTAKTPASAPDGPGAKTPTTPDTQHATTSAVDTDATPAKPKPDADTTPRDRTPDADAQATETPEADATGPTKAREADVEAKPEQKAEQKPEQKPTDPIAEKAPGTDPRTSHPDPKVRAETIADDLKRRTGAFGEVDPPTVERIMRDPDAMRELRKSHPDLWKKVTAARARIYEGHDAKLKSWIEDNVPDARGRDVEIRNVGTPDGVDRDYRAGYVVTDAATGRQRFIELKKESWVAESQRIFAEQTGGPTDRDGASRWAKEHQQLGTDQYHAEASVDMADQATVFNEATGTWEKTQVTPNIDLVKQGRSTLLDPEGYGKTYETKVMEAYAEGNTLDAYKQASKATHSLEGVRDGYDMQGYEVKDLPPRIREGMQAVKDVEAGRIKPAEAEARLKAAGYSGGLPDFMEKVSGQFAGFKWARKR